VKEGAVQRVICALQATDERVQALGELPRTKVLSGD
jgi:hypothetical protein